MLVKRVLEQARTIEQAHAIIRDATVFVSDSYLVASRDEKRAVVIEKSPLHCWLREPTTAGVILQTNHFLGDAWKEDPVHTAQMQQATTLYRWQRLEELTEKVRGKINARECLLILRDKKGRGGKDMGYGNRNAIDAGICAHSVIMNVTRGEMWVCAGPNTYGEYVYVPAANMLAAKPAGALRMSLKRTDNLSRDARFTLADDMVEFRKQLNFAREALDSGDLKELEPPVRSLRNINPMAFETAYYQGHVAYMKEKYAEAAKHFAEALERDPHYEEVRERIRVWLRRATDKSE
jgi:hypothetical protein